MSYKADKRIHESFSTAQNANIILVDIEGTTTSITFVKDTLFPYARQKLDTYVRSNWDKPEFQEVLTLLREQANKDVGDKVEGVVPIPDGDEGAADAVIMNVLWQMDLDRKTKALKQLQGHIWQDGYKNCDLKGHVYPDVVPSLRAWVKDGRQVYVYSSGSVEAQKLLFGHLQEGSVLDIFSGHFDTEVGPKVEASSYLNIANKLSSSPDNIVFFTDVVKEAEAAKSAGLNAVLVVRDGNAPLRDEDKVRFPVITSFQDYVFEVSAKKQKLCLDSEPVDAGKVEFKKGQESVFCESEMDVDMVCVKDCDVTCREESEMETTGGTGDVSQKNSATLQVDCVESPCNQTENNQAPTSMSEILVETTISKNDSYNNSTDTISNEVNNDLTEEGKVDTVSKVSNFNFRENGLSKSEFGSIVENETYPATEKEVKSTVDILPITEKETRAPMDGDGDARPPTDGDGDGDARPPTDGDGDARPPTDGDGDARPPTDDDTSPPTDVDARPPTDVDARPPTDVDARPPTDVDVRPPTDVDARPPTDVDARPPTDVDARPPTDVDARPPKDVDARPPTDVDARPPKDVDARPPTDVDTRPPTDVDARPPTDVDAGPPTDDETRPPMDVDARPPTDVDAGPPTDVDARSPTDVDARAPTDVDARAPTDVDARPPTDVDARPPTDVDARPPTDVDARPPTDVDARPPTDVDARPPTDVDARPPTDVDARPPTDVDARPPTDVDAMSPTDIFVKPPTDVDARPPTDVDAMSPTDIFVKPPTDIFVKPPMDVDARPPSDVDGWPPSGVDARSPSDVDARPPSDVDARPPSDVDARPPSDVDARPPSDVDARPPSDVDARPPSDVDARPPTDVDASPPMESYKLPAMESNGVSIVKNEIANNTEEEIVSCKNRKVTADLVHEDPLPVINNVIDNADDYNRSEKNQSSILPKLVQGNDIKLESDVKTDDSKSSMSSEPMVAKNLEADLAAERVLETESVLETFEDVENKLVPETAVCVSVCAKDEETDTAVVSNSVSNSKTEAELIHGANDKVDLNKSDLETDSMNMALNFKECVDKKEQCVKEMGEHYLEKVNDNLVEMEAIPGTEESSTVHKLNPIDGTKSVENKIGATDIDIKGMLPAEVTSLAATEESSLIKTRNEVLVSAEGLGNRSVKKDANISAVEPMEVDCDSIIKTSTAVSERSDTGTSNTVDLSTSGIENVVRSEDLSVGEDSVAHALIPDNTENMPMEEMDVDESIEIKSDDKSVTSSPQQKSGLFNEVKVAEIIPVAAAHTHVGSFEHVLPNDETASKKIVSDISGESLNKGDSKSSKYVRTDTLKEGDKMVFSQSDGTSDQVTMKSQSSIKENSLSTISQLMEFSAETSTINDLESKAVTASEVDTFVSQVDGSTPINSENADNLLSKDVEAGLQVQLNGDARGTEVMKNIADSVANDLQTKCANDSNVIDGNISGIQSEGVTQNVLNNAQTDSPVADGIVVQPNSSSTAMHNDSGTKPNPEAVDVESDDKPNFATSHAEKDIQSDSAAVDVPRRPQPVVTSECSADKETNDVHCEVTSSDCRVDNGTVANESTTEDNVHEVLSAKCTDRAITKTDNCITEASKTETSSVLDDSSPGTAEIDILKDCEENKTKVEQNGSDCIKQSDETDSIKVKRLVVDSSSTLNEDESNVAAQ